MVGADCDGDETPRPIFRDIRRYCCEYCGICRSKKSLIVVHMRSQHKEELDNEEVISGKNCETNKSNTCDKCGATFKKPAYLKQHMHSHLLERPFICSVEDCSASYRRKDHLTRHALQHEGKLFTCHLDGCKTSFTIKSNLKRHLKDSHLHESPPSPNPKTPKEHVCPEEGCGKVFKYASQLRKHEDSHVKLESSEAICSECMETFSNVDCLKAHISSSHQHATCEICGSKQLRKNLKRHLLTHEKNGSSKSEVIKCHFPDCDHTFSTESNVRTHVKAVHLELKPYVCCHPDCGKRFSYRHVRDHHEQTGCHVYTPGDFVEADEQFQARPRGGRKRKMPPIESLLRKRVCLDLNFLPY